MPFLDVVRRRSLFLALTLFVPTGACLPSIDGPFIAIVEPAEGFLNSSSAIVQVAVGEFELDPDAYGGTPVDGHGHWHLFLNDQRVAATGFASAEVFALSERSHSLRAELVLNDHSSFDPPITHEVDIEVTDESRGLYITGPVPGEDGTYSHGSANTPLLVEVSPRMFGFVDYFTNPKPAECLCEGHWHILWDGKYIDAVSSTGYTLEAKLLTTGTHTLRVQLVQNDHADILPIVADELTVIVP